MATFKVGDVVEVAGMRGIIREERNGRFRVSAGRTDEGVWIDSVDMHLTYREGYGSNKARWVPVRTDAGYHLRLVGANGEIMLNSEVYTSGLEAVTNVIRVLQETIPILETLVDERTMSDPKTQEEKVAFRKDWDKRVEEGKRANDDAN